MSGARGPRAVAGVVVGLLVVAVAALHPAAAAQLLVTATPIQTWEVTDLPGVDEPSVDLSMCGDLAGYDDIVYGTPGDDVIAAGNRRQVLVGLAGDDVLSGGNHDDCLVGGDGDDRLRGGNGRDLLFGQDGADDLDGGTGKDLLDAGADPGDVCTSAGAPDVVVGCEPPERAEDLSTTEDTTAPSPDPTATPPDAVEPEGGSDSGPDTGPDDAGASVPEASDPAPSTETADPSSAPSPTS